eukprot:3502912-Amphidinium_carterae.1
MALQLAGQQRDKRAASSFLSCSSTSAAWKALTAAGPATAKRSREVCIDAEIQARRVRAHNAYKHRVPQEARTHARTHARARTHTHYIKTTYTSSTRAQQTKQITSSRLYSET